MLILQLRLQLLELGIIQVAQSLDMDLEPLLSRQLTLDSTGMEHLRMLDLRLDIVYLLVHFISI